jgi:hypothetical protein
MSQAPANGALSTIIGKISNGATWDESISILVNSSPSTGYSNDSWTFTFRESEDDTAATVSLTSSSSTLVYTEVTTATTASTLRINAAPANLAALVGDYVCDLASESTAGVVTHWGHGRVTFLNQPIR